MPKTEVVLQMGVELDLDVQQQLRSELTALADVRRQIKELEAVAAPIEASIESIRETVGEKTLKFEGASITRITPKDRRKLNEADVVRRFDITLDDLNSCAKYTPVKPSTRITLPGEPAPEEF